MSICMYISTVPGHDLLQYMQLFIDSFIVITLADYTVHIRTYICNIVFPKQRATVLILTWIGSWLMVRYVLFLCLFVQLPITSSCSRVWLHIDCPQLPGSTLHQYQLFCYCHIRTCHLMRVHVSGSRLNGSFSKSSLKQLKTLPFWLKSSLPQGEPFSFHATVSLLVLVRVRVRVRVRV